jgi:mono/diheme cytochrome c family protein
MMKKTILFSSIAIVAFLFAQSCGSDTKPKENSDSGNQGTISASVNGQVLYEEKCTMCHGADGKQNTMGAKDLSASTINHETVVATITSGKNGMKAFSPELNAEQIEAVAHYAESLRK